MRTVIATDRQSIVDLAVQYYGTPSAVIDLCLDNGWELDHDVQPGDHVLLQDTYPDSADNDTADYLQSNSVVVVGTIGQISGSLLGTNDEEVIVTEDDDFIGT